MWYVPLYYIYLLFFTALQLCNRGIAMSGPSVRLSVCLSVCLRQSFLLSNT